MDCLGLEHRVPPRTVPVPLDDDPTDEVPPYERLMRRYAHPAEPDLSIEEEIEREGLADEDPFAGFAEVAAVELAEPDGPVDELVELDAAALEPVDDPPSRTTR